jgi:hypothetical protein
MRCLAAVLVSFALVSCFGAGPAPSVEEPSTEVEAAESAKVEPRSEDPRVAPVPTSAKALLQALQSAVRGKDWDGVRNLVYDLNIGGESINDMAVAGIQGELAGADFSYSDEAITAILDHHLNKFGPPDAKNFAILQKNFARDAPELAQKSADEFLFLEENNAVMLLVKDGDALKILFWEDLASAIK